MTKGLGRGLSSLIPPKENRFSAQASVAASSRDLQDASRLQITYIPIDRIAPNPLQPRQHFDEKNLQQLQDSIEQHGLLEPIVVTQHGDSWQLVAGERRFRACTALGHKTIPAIVRTASDLERLELALIENIQRHDLNPMEKAYSMEKLVGDFGLTQEEAAKKLGMARSTLANILRLLDLPTEIQHGLAAGKITEGHAKILLGLESVDDQLRTYTQLTTGSAMSVRELADTVEKPGIKKSKKKHSIADMAAQQDTDAIQNRLGTKVTITAKSSGGKRIVIDTFSEEEYRRVFDQLV